MRLWWTFLFLAGLFLVPFLIWGDGLAEMFGRDGAATWLERYGSWAWMAGLALLMSDLFLPIPGTAVMAALGLVYGPLTGGLISAAGSCLAGLLAYGLCRLLGRKVAARLVGEKDLERGEEWFGKMGGWLVALSRWLPLLPEVVACMAGLTRMPLRSFCLALGCGSIPLGFTFAAVGHTGSAHPTTALVLSAALPPVLWFGVQRYLNEVAGRNEESGAEEE